MRIASRVIPLLTMSLGFLGVLVCGAGVVGVWMGGSQLHQTVEDVFVQIDKSLAAVGDTVAAAGERVRAAKIAAEDIEEALRSGTGQEASERLASRLGLEEKAERLASGLEQADHWLEFSESSVHIVQQALDLARSAGAPLDVERSDKLLEDLASLRSRVAEASESAETIRQRAAGSDEGKSLRDGMDQAVRLALRLIATLSSVDARLADFEDRLSEMRAEARGLNAKTSRWIRIAAVAVTFILLWMAAGQWSLCLHGWRKRGPEDARRPGAFSKRDLQLRPE